MENLERDHQQEMADLHSQVKLPNNTFVIIIQTV